MECISGSHTPCDPRNRGRKVTYILNDFLSSILVQDQQLIKIIRTLCIHTNMYIILFPTSVVMHPNFTFFSFLSNWMMYIIMRDSSWVEVWSHHVCKKSISTFDVCNNLKMSWENVQGCYKYHTCRAFFSFSEHILQSYSRSLVNCSLLRNKVAPDINICRSTSIIDAH